MDQLSQDEGAILIEPSEPFLPIGSDLSGVQAAPATADDRTLAEFEEWFEETRAHVAEAAAAPATTEKKPRQEPPDWLKGLAVEAVPEAPARAEEQAQEAPSEPMQPAVTAPAAVEPELEAPAAVSLPQEVAPAESVQIPVETALAEGDTSATVATEPAPLDGIEAGPVPQEPEGEPGTVTLFEEPAEQALYGEGTPAPQTPVEPLAAQEAEPTLAPSAPMPAEPEPVVEQARTTESQRRRDPKGYAHLLRARGQCEDSRLGEALKEYDYLVQHSPRLIDAVIADLEAMVREMDVPLEAHRILGDAYTRADRLADALECYRFVLQRVS